MQIEHVLANLNKGMQLVRPQQKWIVRLISILMNSTLYCLILYLINSGLIINGRYK